MPSTYTRPGVYTIEQLAGIQPAPAQASPSVAGFIGEHWRGPVGLAIQCNSWSDFLTYFGGFNPSATPVLANPYLAYSVYEYFMNGGQTAYVARVGNATTPGATALLTLFDGNATPKATLKLALGYFGKTGNPGTWGNSVYCDVVPMPNAPTRFLLNIYNGGTNASNLVETWSDLSMTSTDSRYAPSILNSPTAGSMWIVATDMVDTNASNYPNAASGQQFAGGFDVADPATTDWQAAVTAGTAPFDSVPGMLNFCLPGVVTTTILITAIAYAQARPYSFLVMDGPSVASGETVSAIVTFVGTSLAPLSSYAALYWPWVTVQNPSSSNLSVAILLPPSGFVLGQYVSSDRANGVWKSPAGLATPLVGVISAETVLTPSQLGTLNAGNVNALRTLPNGQVVIWGTRTMQSGFASLYVPIRRTLNYIESTLSTLLESEVFAPNDAASWTTVIAMCTNFLAGLYNLGAFAGSSTEQAFYVICDGTNNTPQSIAQGILNVTVGVALVSPIEFIILTISQNQSTGTTTVSVSS